MNDQESLQNVPRCDRRHEVREAVLYQLGDAPLSPEEVHEAFERVRMRLCPELVEKRTPLTSLIAEAEASGASGMDLQILSLGGDGDWPNEFVISIDASCFVRGDRAATQRKLDDGISGIKARGYEVNTWICHNTDRFKIACKRRLGVGL